MARATPAAADAVAISCPTVPGVEQTVSSFSSATPDNQDSADVSPTGKSHLTISAMRFPPANADSESK